MPTFSDQIRENQIILIASIAVSQANVGSRRSYRALLDTGAQLTMVSDRVVQEVGLQAIGNTQIVPVTGDSVVTEKYRVRVDIPINTPVTSAEGNVTLERTLRGMDMEVARLPYEPRNHDVLLGMDFLQGFHLTIYGGMYILSI